jgi:hypothetical protein
LLLGCTSGKPTPTVVTNSPTSDPAVNAGQASGGVTAVQMDTQDAAISLGEQVAALESVILDAGIKGWNSVSGKASEVVGSLRRTAQVLKAKDAQFKVIDQNLKDTQVALAAEQKQHAADVVAEQAKTKAESQRADKASSAENKWFRYSVYGYILLAIGCAAGGLVLIFAYPTLEKLGRGLAIAGGAVILISGLTLTYVEVTEKMVPWILGGIGVLLVMALGTAAYAIVINRGKLKLKDQADDQWKSTLPGVAKLVKEGKFPEAIAALRADPDVNAAFVE